MNKYEIITQDGISRKPFSVEAQSAEVNSNGDLSFWVHGDRVAAYAKGYWLSVNMKPSNTQE